MMKLALVHDDFTQLGGAERLFEEIAKIFPSAPIYTSLVNWDKIPRTIDRKRINVSFMQKIPLAKKFYKALLPLYPLAFESFDFSGYDLVISSTTRFAKSVITGPNTKHISYINSVPRFIYSDDKKSDYLPRSISRVISPYIKWLKRWDMASAARVDVFIANSKNVQKSIEKTYGRESVVVYPGVDTEFFTAESKRHSVKASKYYLVVSRLVKWKRIDIAIESLGRQKLIVVGTGPDEDRLESLARSKNVEFRKNVTREELKTLYQNTQALIVTQDEDFGISAVEAQACGTPVVGYGEGGIKETVIDGITGVLYKDQGAKSLKDAIERSSRLKYNRSEIRNNALRFSKTNFKNSLKKAVETYVKSA